MVLFCQPLGLEATSGIYCSAAHYWRQYLCFLPVIQGNTFSGGHAECRVSTSVHIAILLMEPEPMSAPCPIPFGQLQGGQTEGSEHFTFHWRRREGEKGDLSPACKAGSENITFVRPWRIYPGQTPLLLLKSCKWVKEASPLQQIHGKFIKFFLSSLNYEPGNGPPQHCILLWERGKLKQGICSVLLKGRRPPVFLS